MTGKGRPNRIVVEGFRDCGVSTSNLVLDEACETEVSKVVVYNDGNKSSAVHIMGE